MKAEDSGCWITDRSLSAVIVLSKYFSSSELISKLLALDNLVSDVLASNDSEFETVDLEGR